MSFHLFLFSFVHLFSFMNFSFEMYFLCVLESSSPFDFERQPSPEQPRRSKGNHPKEEEEEEEEEGKAPPTQERKRAAPSKGGGEVGGSSTRKGKRATNSTTQKNEGEAAPPKRVTIANVKDNDNAKAQRPKQQDTKFQ